MTVTHNAAAGGKKESALVKFAVSGGVTLVYEVCLGHFLEFLKGVQLCSGRAALSDRAPVFWSVLLTRVIFCSCKANATGHVLSNCIANHWQEGHHWRARYASCRSSLRQAIWLFSTFFFFFFFFFLLFADGFIPFGAIQALAKGSVFGWGQVRRILIGLHFQTHRDSPLQVAALNSLQPLVHKDYMTHQVRSSTCSFTTHSLVSHRAI
jgi:hypothetical protein